MVRAIWATRPVNAMRAQFVLHYLASSIFPSAELDSSAFRDAVYGLWPLLLVHFLSCRGNLSGTSEAFFSFGPWNESVTFPASYYGGRCKE